MSKIKKHNTVILISGYKRAGKDFVGGLLHSRLPNSEMYSYATPIKTIIAQTLGIDVQELEELKNARAKLYARNHGVGVPLNDARQLLQAFGTEAMKPWFGDAVWAEVLTKQDIASKYIIVTDWRFKVEYTSAVAAFDNVVTLRVNDEHIVNTDTHASETEILDFPFDYVIDNTSKDSTVNVAIEEFIATITKGSK